MEIEYREQSLFDVPDVEEKALEVGEFFIDDLYMSAYESIPEADRMPICMPSYNNFDSDTMKVLSSSELEWPIYIIVRNSQKARYEELYKKATIVGVEDDLINSGTKAKKYIFEHFSGDIFQFDDDLVSITYCKPGLTKEGKPKTCRNKEADPIRVIAMWQLIHKKVMSSCNGCWATEPVRDLYSWSYDIRETNTELAINSQPSSIFAVNTDVLASHGVFIDAEISADDICTYWLALDKGLWPAQLKLITCELGKPGLEHYGKGCNTLKDRFEMQSNELFAKYNFPWSRRKEHKTFGSFYATNTKVMRQHLMHKGTYPLEIDVDYRRL